MNNPLVQPDPGLFIWTIITFLVLLALLAKFAWKPLLQALEGRQERIRRSLEDADKARQELERLQQESAKIMQQARIEAESIVAQTRADADRLREELKQKAKDEADNILRTGHRQIKSQTGTAVRPKRTKGA